MYGYSNNRHNMLKIDTSPSCYGMICITVLTGALIQYTECIPYACALSFETLTIYSSYNYYDIIVINAG